jgi:PKD repeat protein
MDVNARQELGWLVPRELKQGETTVSGWVDSKQNTHRIDWQQPDGTPYTLSGPSVANGEAYIAKLPAKKIIDPAKMADASGDFSWWSQSGNDFGCAPNAGHNLDVFLPELASVAAGTPVTVTFKSYWDIEWDYDYGFVMTSTDGGETYTSHASANGYTTDAAFNPTANACQTQFGNGLTGTSGSYAAGTFQVDRAIGEYPDGSFLADEYDISSAAGKATVLRFSYATDPGLARPGWFVDDVVVKAGETVIYSSDFEEDHDERLFNGGCTEHGRVAAACTSGWQHVSAATGSPADHAYYLELRDRSSFDLDGKGQADRGPATFLPGLSLVYTNEAHGYGNAGTGDPPAQSPLDSQPQPGENIPNLDDAAWTAAAGDNAFSDSGDGWTDNYADPGSADGNWHFRFDCLTFEVLSMAGDSLGPATGGDLTGDVRFTIGQGCAAYDWGHGEPTVNAAPTAVAQAKPLTAAVNGRVQFDGSRSYDDRQAASELSYAWDYTSDGEVDSTRQNASHRYRSPGVFTATLKVTDADGASSTSTVRVTVTQ